MFGLFKSKEEKELEKDVPFIAEQILHQIVNATERFVKKGDDGKSMTTFVSRVHSREAHAYFFEFVQAYCEDARSALSRNEFAKVYMIIAGKVWRELFSYDYMQLMLPLNLEMEGDPLDPADCWEDLVNNLDDSMVKNAQLHGRYDCLDMVIAGADPTGLTELLSAEDWINPPPPKKPDYLD